MASIINSDDGVISGTAGLKSTGANDGALNIQTNGSNAISISSGQRSTFPTTIGVGGATPATSGSGITFPATASASSDANTLDDYEEGTFTPTLGGTATYSVQTGQYTKVGNLVYIKIVLVISAIGTGSTTVISGLPFVNKSGGTGALSTSSFFASATSVISFFPSIANGGTTITISSLASAGTTEAANAIFQGNTQIQISGCYNV